MALLLALQLIAFAALPENRLSAPIPLGDPKRCLRILVGLSCGSPGEVSFEAGIRDHTFTFVRVLPPMESPDRTRVAECILGHPDHYVQRFLGAQRNESGNYVLTVSPHVEVCSY